MICALLLGAALMVLSFAAGGAHAASSHRRAGSGSTHTQRVVASSRQSTATSKHKTCVTVHVKSARHAKTVCSAKRKPATKKKRVGKVSPKEKGAPAGAGPGVGSEGLEEQSPVVDPEDPGLPADPAEVATPAETVPTEATPTETDPTETKPTETKRAEPPPTETTPVKETPPPEEPVKPFRFFAPTSFWNATPAKEAPLDPTSSSVVKALVEEVNAEELEKKAPTINTTSWSVPIYTVPAGQSNVRVKLVNTVSPALQAAWNVVPLPANAKPAVGSDAHLVVWQPSKDLMWEFWGLNKTTEGWQASWGGAMEHVSADVGVYGPEAWSGATVDWGASASSLPIAGGLITLEDLEQGKINHALAIAVPNVRETTYALPAKRTDGYSKEAFSLPEGAHLVLEPTLNLASLHLSHFTLMLAEAAQKYGIFVRDRAANVALYGQDPTPTGNEPYGGSHGFLEGKAAWQQLASFPWSHLELLKMELH